MLNIRNLFVKCMEFLLYDVRALILLAIVLTVSLILAFYTYADIIARKR